MIKAIIRRLLWKREVARAKFKIWSLECMVETLQNQRDVANASYQSNLHNLQEANAESQKWKEKYYEARRLLRSANKGAQRNSLVAQLATSRLYEALKGTK